MKGTARGTGKDSEKDSERLVLWESPVIAAALVTGGVWRKKVTAGAVASLAIARVSVLLVRRGGPNRLKTTCLVAVAANQASGTKG
jgi:hypothetical protein